MSKLPEYKRDTHLGFPIGSVSLVLVHVDDRKVNNIGGIREIDDTISII